MADDVKSFLIYILFIKNFRKAGSGNSHKLSVLRLPYDNDHIISFGWLINERGVGI